ncbi:MAG: inositol monophosphatase family protein [Nitriliruptorales bacterium]
MTRTARLEEALRFAHELADLADEITLPAFRSGVLAEVKADGSPVTAADRNVERALRRAIQERFAGHAVLGEEDGLHGPEGAPTWIVDPIDGTKSFVAGVPVYATLIALVDEGRGVVGLVSAPALGTRWDGIAGGPARQDGEEVRVSTVTELAQAMVSFGGLNYFDLDVIGRFATATARQRGFGDFWQHCLVASGGIDLALEAEVDRWDLAAPKVIVEAAGGRLTALDGRDTDDGGNALSSNRLLHDAALELVHRR